MKRKISLILLASGNSIRFHGNKLLTLIDMKPMYLHAVEKVIDLNFSEIIMITQYREIEETLKRYNIKVIINEKSNLGISHSIKLGIEASQICDGYMFMVCDQPFLEKESIKKLLSAFEKTNKNICCLSYRGELGNPNIFSTKYKYKLLSLKGDKGGKSIIKKHIIDTEIIDTTNQMELYDIDTKQSLFDLFKYKPQKYKF